MTVSIAYSLNDVAKVLIIRELRKFFSFPLVSPYDQLLPTNFWAAGINDDITYHQVAAGKPDGTLFIVDEESYDDRRLPCIIVSSMSGGMKPSGFGQVGLKSIDTIETITTPVMPVRVASPMPGNLATAFHNGSVVDKVTLVTGDRILLMTQTNGAENGPYVVNASGAPDRAPDFNSAPQFVQWTLIPVTEGKVLGGRQFAQITAQPITLDTTPIFYEELEFDELVEISEPTIKFLVKAQTTSQRDRITDTLMLAMSNKKLVRGELEKQDIIIQPTSPGFIRNDGYTEESVTQGTGYQMIYKADLTSTLWLQWNYRTLIDALIAADIVAKDDIGTLPA